MVLTLRILFFIILLASTINAQEMDTLVDFNKLWDYNDPVATETKFKDLIPAAEQSGDLSYKLQLKTQIARCMSLQRKFEDAHQLLDEVEQELNEDLKIATIRYHLEKGRTFNSANDKGRAEEQFQWAINLSTEAGEDFYLVDALHMFAIIKESEEALHYNLEAVNVAEKSEDPRAKKWLGSLYNNIGWTYHDMKMFDKSLQLFLKAEEWHKEFGSERSYGIARWCVAKGMRMVQRIDEALEILQTLEVEGKTDGYTYEELGECYLIKGNKGKANDYFFKAYELLSQDKWLMENEAKRMARLKELSSK
ncbi:MAG: hypothetical protein HKN92_05245 [Chitinophagales bacterium]|nr:hypothetical protein [Chitinophagales bacterium]